MRIGEFERRLSVELRVAYVGRRMTARALAAVGDVGLSEGAWWTLYELSGVPDGLSLVELARRTAFSASAVTAVTDTLAARGWISRERDGEDRRRVVAVITEEGLIALDAGLTCAEQAFATDHVRLSPAQWDSLDRLLALLLADAEVVGTTQRAAAR